MRTLLWALLVTLCPAGLIHAQNATTKIRPLTIGDTIPSDLVLTNVYNYPVSKIQLSDLKGKLVILDFFATSCAGCVRDIPKLDSLQRVFDHEILIIPITYEDKSKVAKFIASNRMAKGTILSVATNDTLFSSLFPHAILSHEIWVDGQGIVRAITEPEIVTAQNIEGILSGTISRLPIKRDRLDFNRQIPLPQLSGTIGKYYSLVIPQMDGIPGFNEGMFRDTINNTVRFFALNITLPDLYERTLDKDERLYYVPDYKLIRSQSLPILKSKEQWCYETLLPINTTLKSIRKKIRTDLDCYFGLQTSIEQTSVRCLVLRRTTSDAIGLKSINPNQEVRLSSDNKNLYIHNDKLTELVLALNREIPSIPVIDETGYSNPVDLELGTVSLQDLLLYAFYFYAIV